MTATSLIATCCILLDRLPEIINQPQAVLYDTKPKGKYTSHVLLYVFDGGDKKKGKVVVKM